MKKCIFNIYETCVVVKNLNESFKLEFEIKDLEDFVKRYCSLCIKIYTMKYRSKWGVGVTL